MMQMSEQNHRIVNGNKFAQTATKVVAFGASPVGWHYGCGIPAAATTVQRALDLLNFCGKVGLYDTDAFPGSDGEIAITAYSGTFYLRVGLEADDSHTVLLQDQGEDILEKDDASLTQAYAMIENAAKIIERACPTSGWSILDPLTRSVQSSTTMPSNTTLRMDVFQLLASNVFINQVSGSANILGSIIQGSPESHQYFGNLKEPTSNYILRDGV